MTAVTTINTIPENLANQPTDQFLSSLHDQLFQVLALLKGGILTVTEQTETRDLLLEAAHSQLDALHNEIDQHMVNMSHSSPT